MRRATEMIGAAAAVEHARGAGDPQAVITSIATTPLP